MSRRLFLLSQALLLAVFLLAPGQGIAQAKSAQPKIEIYVTSWCPYCKKAVAYFQAKGLTFTVHDIESNPGAAKRFEQFHAQGVPLVVINGKKISGYSVEAYEKALGTK